MADDDIALLKREHHAYSVRLAEAGCKADISFAVELKKRAFFRRQRFDLDRPMAYLSCFGAAAYFGMCAFIDVDPELAAYDDAEASSIAMRDIVGYDFLS